MYLILRHAHYYYAIHCCCHARVSHCRYVYATLRGHAAKMRYFVDAIDIGVFTPAILRLIWLCCRRLAAMQRAATPYALLALLYYASIACLFAVAHITRD